MRKILLFFFVISCYSAVCQSLSPEGIFPACVNYSTEGYAQISWTLGDTQTLTQINNDVILTQGFLQPNFTITGISPFVKNDNIQCLVFPNPVKDILNLQYSANKKTDLIINLFNLEGKILYNEKINTSNQSSVINFESLQSGYYILKVFSKDESFLKSYKILFQK